MRRHILLAVSAIVILSIAPTAFGQLKLGTGVRADEKEYVPGGDAYLLDREYVRVDLNLTKEQSNKITAAVRELMKMKMDNQKKGVTLLPSEAAKRDAIWKEYNDASAKLVNDVLTEKQRERFKQIVYQTCGLEPFFRDEVRKALDLKRAQIEDLKKLVLARREDIRKGLGDSAKQATQLQNKYSDKAKSLLSDEQKQQWSTLVGRTIDVNSKAPAPSKQP